MIWGTRDPLGRELRFVNDRIETSGVPPALTAELGKAPIAEGPWEVVGVVKDVRMFGLDTGARPTVYVDYRQQDGGLLFGSLKPKLIVRTKGTLAAAIPRLVQVLHDRLQPVRATEAVSFDDLLERLRGRRGSNRVLSAASLLLGAMAAVLMGAGIFTLVSEVVKRRQHEIAIRMTFGADSTDIAVAVMREVIPVAMLGLGLGITASANLSHFMRSRLIVGAVDSDPWLTTGLLLGLIVPTAAALPLRRASRANLAQLLRAN